MDQQVVEKKVSLSVSNGVDTGHDDIGGTASSHSPDASAHVPQGANGKRQSPSRRESRIPAAASTHTGVTRQGQQVTVRKWYLNQDSKTDSRTSDDTSSQSRDRSSLEERRQALYERYMRGRGRHRGRESVGIRSEVASSRTGSDVSSTRTGSDASSTGTRSGASSTGTRSGVSSTGTRSGVSSTGTRSGVSSTGTRSGVSSTGTRSGVSSTGTRSGVSSTGTRSGVSSTGTRSGVSLTGTRSGVSSTGTRSGVSSTGTRSGVSSTGTRSGVSSTGTRSGVSLTGTRSGVSSIGTRSGVSSTGTRSGVSSTGTRSGVSSTGTRSGVSSIGTRSGVSSIGTRSGVSSTGTRSGVSSTGTRSGVSSTGTRSGVSSTGTRSGVSSTGTRRSVSLSGTRISGTSTREAGVRTFIPRTREALDRRHLPPVYHGRIQKSRTYVYPFANQEQQRPNSRDGSLARGQIRANNPRATSTGKRYVYTRSRQRQPLSQNHGGRGSESEALSSGGVTERHYLQLSKSDNRPISLNPRPRQTQYSSNSSLTTTRFAANPQRRTAQDTHYRPRTYRGFRTNRGSTSFNSGDSQRQPTLPQPRTSYESSQVHRRESKGSRLSSSADSNSRRQPRVVDARTPSTRSLYRGSERKSRVHSSSDKNYPSTQLHNPIQERSHSNTGGTQYASSPEGHLQPRVQRTFRQRQLPPGYSRQRNPGSYPQSSGYSRRTSSNFFTSLDVADDGDCPNTGIDLRINGLDCRQAVQNFGSYLCYLHEYTSKQCCETCLQRKRPDQVGCEYGDHARLCSNISPSDCYDRRNELSCCETCTRFKKNGVEEMCQWGDMIGSQRCQEVRRNPGLCYMPDNARLCCETCGRVKNSSNPTCPYGDQNTRMCQIYGPSREVQINCYSPYRRRLCCQSCQRLKDWLPQTMPADCEYGDRPVMFNTVQYGRLNCAQLLTYVSVDECRTNPMVSKNCCYTCSRYLNSLPSTGFE